MSELAVRWVAVAPSVRQRRLRNLAIAITAGVLAALLVVHVSGAIAGALWAGLTFSLGAAAALVRRPPRPADERQWSIAADGRVAVRLGDQMWPDVPPVFVSSAFIVLRTGRRTLEIWCEATPIEAFRRLSVAVRWPARRPTALH